VLGWRLAVLAGLDDPYASRADHQVLQSGRPSWQGDVVQDQVAPLLQGLQRAGRAALGCGLPTPRHGAGGGAEAQSPPGGQRRPQGHERAQPGAHGEADQQVDAGGRPDHRPHPPPPAMKPGPELLLAAALVGGLGGRAGAAAARILDGASRQDPSGGCRPDLLCQLSHPLRAQPADGQPDAAHIVLVAAAGSAVLAALASHLGPPPAGRSALSTRRRSGPRRRRRRVPPTPPRPRRRARPTS
jgi:hypothetical protein